MLSDVLRIKMMHSERSYDCRTENGSLEMTPCISSPVQHSRYPIYEEIGSDKAQHYRQGTLVVLNGLLYEEIPEYEGEGEIGHFPDALGPRIAVLPKLFRIVLAFTRLRCFDLHVIIDNYYNQQ